MATGPIRPDSLSRERILDAAGAIVTAEGSAALSMRRLAQELDVWPMSIYRHFKNKDELLDAVAAAATESIAVPDIDASWRAQLRSLLDAVRDVIGSDPSGVGTRLPNAFLTPGGLRLSEAGMRILESAGFDPAEAASAWRALWSFTFGFAAFRLAPTAPQAVRRARVAIAALTDEDYPMLLGAANQFAATWADDDEFEYGLERLLDGIETRMQAALAPARGTGGVAR